MFNLISRRTDNGLALLSLSALC